MKTKNYYWAEKTVTKSDWKSHYCHLNNYTFLGEEERGILVGFLTCELSLNVLEIFDEDKLRRIDLHRRASNLRPTPFLTEEEKEEKKRYYDHIRKCEEEREKSFKEKEAKGGLFKRSEAVSSFERKKAKEYFAMQDEKEKPINLQDIPF